MSLISGKGLDINSLAESCMKCSVCGTPPQTPPILGVFPKTADTLVVLTAPLVVDYNDKAYLLVEAFEDGMVLDAASFEKLYKFDFAGGEHHELIDSILGDDWLLSGEYALTFAARCRMVVVNDNVSKSCSLYTRQILQGFNKVILLGEIAAKQVLGSVPTEWDTVRVIRGKAIYTISHYPLRSSISSLKSGLQQLHESGKLLGSSK